MNDLIRIDFLYDTNPTPIQTWYANTLEDKEMMTRLEGATLGIAAALGEQGDRSKVKVLITFEDSKPEPTRMPG
jgi:hypothetical protein